MPARDKTAQQWDKVLAGTEKRYCPRCEEVKLKDSSRKMRTGFEQLDTLCRQCRRPLHRKASRRFYQTHKDSGLRDIKRERQRVRRLDPNKLAKDAERQRQRRRKAKGSTGLNIVLAMAAGSVLFKLLTACCEICQ